MSNFYIEANKEKQEAQMVLELWNGECWESLDFLSFFLTTQLMGS